MAVRSVGKNHTGQKLQAIVGGSGGGGQKSRQSPEKREVKSLRDWLSLFHPTAQWPPVGLEVGEG